MEILHRVHNIRIAPRKLRLVARAVAHKSALEAANLLNIADQKAAGLFKKALRSAIQTAEDNNLDSNYLTIQRVWCDEGMKLKRYVGNSHGRMTGINKHFSHLSILLVGEPKSAARKKAKVTDADKVNEVQLSKEDIHKQEKE